LSWPLRRRFGRTSGEECSATKRDTHARLQRDAIGTRGRKNKRRGWVERSHRFFFPAEQCSRRFVLEMQERNRTWIGTVFVRWVRPERFFVVLLSFGAEAKSRRGRGTQRDEGRTKHGTIDRSRSRKQSERKKRSNARTHRREAFARDEARSLFFQGGGDRETAPQPQYTIDILLLVVVVYFRSDARFKKPVEVPLRDDGRIRIAVVLIDKNARS